MPTDPLGSIRYPDLTYAPNIPSDMQKAVQDIIVKAVPVFATRTARDTAYTNYVSAGGTLQDGAICYCADTGYHQRTGGIWRTLYGAIGHGIATATTTAASTTLVALPTGLQFTTYLQPGRAYRYTAELRVASTVAGDFVSTSARLTTGTPAPTDPLVAPGSAPIVVANGGGTNLMMRRVFQVSTAGNYTVALWGNRTSGTGTVSFLPMGDGNLTNQLEDVGVALPSMPFPA